MIQNQRILFSDDGTESDLSLLLNDFRTGSKTMAVVAAEDYLYIGTDLPFNHKYFYVDSSNPNEEASEISVDIWFGNEWVSAVDVIDHTASSGATLAQSGVIEWKTNRVKGWDLEQDSEDVTGISAVGIYNFFWARFSFSADLTATTAIKYIGNRFSTDDILYSYYPDLDNTNLRTAFESGKSTWDEQHFIASEIIIRDLKRRGIVLSSGQILDHHVFELPAVHKVAELIYRGLGRAYNDDRTAARNDYESAMNIKFFNIDENYDGNLSGLEKGLKTGFLRR